MNHKEIIEAMEGCRSEHDAVTPGGSQILGQALRQDDELRQRYQRIRQWDQALTQSLDDCPVPEGLCSRLLDALQSGDSESITTRPSVPGSTLLDQPTAASSLVELPETSAGDIAEIPLRRGKGVSRRRWLVRSLAVAGSLSLAVLILVSIWWNPFAGPVPQSTTEFAEHVIQWTQLANESSWRTDFEASDLRFDARVRARPHRWTVIPTRYAATTTVYDLSQRHGEPVYLFYFPAQRSLLPSAPPEAPFSTTGGFSIGAWHAGDLVFVLAVRGNQQRYRGLIQAPVILGVVDKDRPNHPTGCA